MGRADYCGYLEAAQRWLLPLQLPPRQARLLARLLLEEQLNTALAQAQEQAQVQAKAAVLRLAAQ